MKMKLLTVLAAIGLIGFGAEACAQSSAPKVVTACSSMSPFSTQNAGTTGSSTVGTNGALCVNGTFTQGTATHIQSGALAANLVVKASSGQLYSFEVSADSTLSAAAWWLMIYDATSAPVDGAVTPAKCYAIPSGSTGFTAGFGTPVTFTVGMVIGVSTTGCFTKTATTHAFIAADYQ
jgi:hypothetical protein